MPCPLALFCLASFIQQSCSVYHWFFFDFPDFCFDFLISVSFSLSLFISAVSSSLDQTVMSNRYTVGFVVTMPDGWSLALWDSSHSANWQSSTKVTVEYHSWASSGSFSFKSHSYVMFPTFRSWDRWPTHDSNLSLFTWDMCCYVGTTAIWLSSVGMEDEEEQWK